MPPAQPDHDVIIVGAGISGISMAAHMQMLCPGRSFAILERRDAIGGTWDLFRYPGIRSDSDMHSFGFRFEPWTDNQAIAGGDAILAYLAKTANSRGIDQAIRFGSTVISANWSSAEALWRIMVEDAAGWHELTARFLYLASGYYDYDEAHDAHLPGLESFSGKIAHPQFWPQDLNYSGKQVVVVGSGATAVTIVPAMAEEAAHVTMLQRTPTWMAAGPSTDKWALRLRRWLPEKWAYALTRTINLRLHDFLVKRARAHPGKFAQLLHGGLRRHLGDAYEARHFDPPYPPWDQRLCFVPDGDLFEVIKTGKAGIVTAEIEQIESAGVRLKDGTFLPADILVTATGLKLMIGGNIDFSVDGKPICWTDHWFYRSCMLSNIPNLAAVFGYLDTSWTLRSDNTAEYICRVLHHMAATGSDIAVPHLDEGHVLQPVDAIHLTSAYLRRAGSMMPNSASQLPWRLNMDYFEDCRDFRQRPVADGELHFQRLAPPAEIA